MTDERYWEVSNQYSNLIKKELKIVLEKKLTSDKHRIVLAATGSLGKKQLTPKSDIDILAIFDNSLLDYKKNDLQNRLNSMNYSHVFEFYPFEKLEAWKDIGRSSLLNSSDVHFATALWGNFSLLRNLKRYVKKENINQNNLVMYSLYNIFYRDNQLKIKNKANSLKYEPGGLRDMQFIKWVCFRVGKSKSSDPNKFLYSLVSKNYISRREYELLIDYVESIMGYKWSCESDISSIFKLQSKKKYELFRLKAINVLNKIKIKLFQDLSRMKGKSWLEVITHARSNTLSNERRWKLSRSSDESLLFCATWNANDLDLLTYAGKHYLRYWSIRASLALNPYTPEKVIEKLNLDLCDDNSDIRKFIKQRKIYEKEN